MHNRIILTVLLAVFVLAVPAYSQTYSHNLIVKEVRPDLGEAVIVNAVAGTESVVSAGQEIDGWRVAQITADHVTFVKVDDERVVIIGNLPPNGGGLIPIAPQP